MRITDATRHREVLANLARTERSLDRAQNQITSGIRVRRASDDPGAARTSLKLDSSVRGMSQHQRSIDAALSRMETEESVLGQLGDALTRAQELGVSQGDDTASAATRAQTKVEVDKLLEFVVQLGNTRTPDGYLFGGYHPETRPFDPASPLTTPVGAGEEQKVEIAPGQQASTTHNGRKVFLDTGAIAALKSLSDALGADDAAGTRAALTQVNHAFEAVQGLTGELGGRFNQLELTQSRLGSMELSAKAENGELVGADMAEAMVEFSTRQNALQAAMLSTSRILGMTLADYLQ